MLIQRANKQFNVPVSVLCRRLSIPRASFYRTGRKEDSELLEAIKSIASKHTAWGYRLIWAELQKQGIRVNHKKVYRIYSFLNLQKPPVVSAERSIPSPHSPLRLQRQSFQGMYGQETSCMTKSPLGRDTGYSMCWMYSPEEALTFRGVMTFRGVRSCLLLFLNGRISRWQDH